MLDFLWANWGTIVIAAAIAAVVVLVVVKLQKDRKKGKSSCGCGCDHCRPRECAIKVTPLKTRRFPDRVRSTRHFVFQK